MHQRAPESFAVEPMGTLIMLEETEVPTKLALVPIFAWNFWVNVLASIAVWAFGPVHASFFLFFPFKNQKSEFLFKME